MANVLLGATGSVAAVKVPDLAAAFTAAGHNVKIVATDAATYFFDIDPLRSILTLDADEWPGERYARGDEVRHIELRKWADIFAIAPLDANTLAKLAYGLADNALTCVWRAWDSAKPILLAPAMNTLMWQHPFTRRHLHALAVDLGGYHFPSHLDEERLIPIINERCRLLRIAAPVTKALACGDIGVGAMAEVATIVSLADELLCV